MTESGMGVARHVINTYFKDTQNPLVRHHLDSYENFLTEKIPNFLAGTNPLKLVLGDGRSIEIFIENQSFAAPLDEFENAVLPHQCRLDNTTYSLTMKSNIRVVYKFANVADSIERKFENIQICQIPLMVRSKHCYLSQINSDEFYNVGECKHELGGYFIIDGAEKVLLTQERLGNNMFYASKRIAVSSSDGGKRTLVEKETVSKLESAVKGEKYEYIAGIRSQSEDGTRGPYSHFLIIPPTNKKPDDPKILAKETDYSRYSTNRLAVITLPGFTQPVPIVSVLVALGVVNDKDIYDTILHGVPESDRNSYDEIIAELILSHEVFIKQEMLKEHDITQDPNMLFLRRQTRTRSNAGVFTNLFYELFPHVSYDATQSSSAFYRRKAYLLGHMVRIACDVAIGIQKPSDRDHFRYKRLDASGELCFQQFRTHFKETAKRMLTEIDTRVHFEQITYIDKKIAELITDENIGYYWRSSNFLNGFKKSFKGKWGGEDGISQELSRLSYLGAVAHLRRVNLQMDKSTKIVEPRRIHSSSWGFMCPTDNPDGHNIGMIKSMTLFSTISTASSAKTILEMLKGHKGFRQLHTIHPSIWNPVWTKVFVNSDLVGVIAGDADTIHRDFIKTRREGKVAGDVSFCWNRMDNIYIINTDAGRIIRPLYREGVTIDEVAKISVWDKLPLDYIDAQETDSLRISMEPFSKHKLSEIHGTSIFSASASVVPNSDFNQAPRNMFSCQQTKQACSWYNTAFNKRFDTIATWDNYAQRPLSQTWTTDAIMGCLPCGENPIVALAIYGGYNQEDSILINDSSLRRGLFNTTYYHSYDITESMIDPAAQTHTEFAGIATDPRFRESVKRKDKNYAFLDADGIILEGSIIDDETVLVGIVSPISDRTSGDVTGHNDVSYTPKRGQTGIIDAVYRYVTSEGLRGVKIRIAERRIPVLGDKFSARHGQKGTCGMRVLEEDMPFTSNGQRPDMIVNPHAFPSRMTIGQFIEMMGTRLGVHCGALVDSTAFASQNRVYEMKELLLKAGYHPYGHEILYNGQTGEMLQSEIFMGPTYYLRLKHMVEDKINYRATGPKKLLTQQPVEGRSNDGGLRIGEMERDSLISHGVSRFLDESLMERSDKHEYLFQPETGLLDANPEYPAIGVSMPYALGLFIHEIESMHISVKLIA